LTAQLCWRPLGVLHIVILVFKKFVIIFVVHQGDAVGQHLSSAASANILMSPMEFQAAAAAANAVGSVSAKISSKYS